ncbi:MAG: hypothetical protein RL199_2287 [Pseudomonadota bacterium]|jgi:LPS export ABC transporter protein LptC
MQPSSAIALAAIALSLAACRPRDRAPAADEPDLVLRSVRARQYEDGRPASRLAARELRLGRSAGRLELVAPATTEEAPVGREVRSERGTLDVRTGRLLLEGHVSLRDAAGAVVEAPAADVDLAGRTARGTDVVVHGDGLTTRADRFTAQGASPKLGLEGHVRTTVDEPGGRR